MNGEDRVAAQAANGECRLLMNSEVWKTFSYEIEKQTLYQCLCGLSLPGLNYLYMLESILGQYEFHSLCPLIAEVDDRFAAKVMPFLNGRLIRSSDQDIICELLKKHYFLFQRKKARELWPRTIGRYIGQVLDAAVGHRFTDSLQKIYKAYLTVRYGLRNNSKPVECSEKNLPLIIKAVYKEADLTESIDSMYTYTNLPWEAQTKLMFADKELELLIISFARSFRRGCFKTWKRIVERSENQFGKPLGADSLLDVDSFLDQDLGVFFSHRISSALSEKRIFTIEDILFFSGLKLRNIPGIGVQTIEDIRRFLKKYGLDLNMTRVDLERWKGKNRKTRFKIESLINDKKAPV